MQLWALSWSQMDPLEDTKGLTYSLSLFPGQLWWSPQTRPWPGTEGHAGFTHLCPFPCLSSGSWLYSYTALCRISWIKGAEQERRSLYFWQGFHLILKTHTVLSKPSLGPPFPSNHPTLSKSTWTVGKEDNLAHSPKEKSWLKSPTCQVGVANWSAEPLLAQVLGRASRPFLTCAVAATWEKTPGKQWGWLSPLCTGPGFIPNSTCISNS